MYLHPPQCPTVLELIHPITNGSMAVKLNLSSKTAGYVIKICKALIKRRVLFIYQLRIIGMYRTKYSSQVYTQVTIVELDIFIQYPRKYSIPSVQESDAYSRSPSTLGTIKCKCIKTSSENIITKNG